VRAIKRVLVAGVFWSVVFETGCMYSDDDVVIVWGQGQGQGQLRLLPKLKI